MADHPLPATGGPGVPAIVAACMAALALTGCTAVAELAYDTSAWEEQRRCEALTSWPERQACLDRVNAARKQADTVRRP